MKRNYQTPKTLTSEIYSDMQMLWGNSPTGSEYNPTNSAPARRHMDGESTL
ncbi:MAG: hypothetical protein IJR74_04395 [Paludibacteraceae bacterium]|nr:hypothetical protein [Paludibacteraceae bacterium]